MALRNGQIVKSLDMITTRADRKIKMDGVRLVFFFPLSHTREYHELETSADNNRQSKNAVYLFIIFFSIKQIIMNRFENI